MAKGYKERQKCHPPPFAHNTFSWPIQSAALSRDAATASICSGVSSEHRTNSSPFVHNTFPCPIRSAALSRDAATGHDSALSTCRDPPPRFPPPVRDLVSNLFLRLPVNQRIAAVAAIVFVLDQGTKFAVLQFLGFQQERIVVDGFFKFVHWGNTGAAWSMFRGQNNLLAGISLVAMVALWIYRRHFEVARPLGQLSLGLLFGGILGNVLDRLMPSRRHVIDFIYFHLHPRGGGEIGFPAFNIADSAICTGVGLMILLSWMHGPAAPPSRA